MRVLIFSLAYLPFIGGAELAVKEITDRISDIEFDLITVNLDGKQPPQERMGNVTVHRIGKGTLAKYFFPSSAFKKAQALHQQRRYDVIWAIMANQAGLAALKLKKKFSGVKYLLTLQEGDSLRSIWLRTWFMRPRYKAIYRRADHIQAISQYLKDRALAYGYRGPASVIPNGVDLALFAQQASSQSIASIREKIGITTNERVIITASRLVEKNGIDLLIRTLRDLKNGQLVVAGVGKLRTKLQALAADIGVAHRVHFIGHVSHRDLPAYLQLADVFVRPSRSEGLGSAFLEAMAAGLPGIATPAGGLPDFLKDRETGIFCAVNNPKDLASKIELVLHDEPLRQRLIENGRRLVRSGYEWDKVAREMNAVLHFSPPKRSGGGSL